MLLEIEAQICQAGRILFERKLTDLAGGNISARMVLASKFLVDK
jgi:ribulose-5-phosphate 4-epimerase/fuculose-1-phosphate aldolase